MPRYLARLSVEYKLKEKISRILPIGCRGGDWIFGVGGGQSDEK
jgi:hypothetical protein